MNKLPIATAWGITVLLSIADIFFSARMILYFWDAEWIKGLLCYIFLTFAPSPLRGITSYVRWIGVIVCLCHNFL